MTTGGVFRYALQEQDQPALLTLLLPDEQQKSRQYRQPADRHRFVAGRAWLRWLVGTATELAPAQVQLTAGPFGKPEFPTATDEAGPWFANVSHAGSWVLVALARTPVGVDLEYVDPIFDYNSLMNSVFSETDRAQISQDPHPHTEFYTRWTRKESLLKATGQGLTNHLPHLPTSPGTHALAPGLLTAPGTWSVCSFAVDTSHVAAVARPAPDTDLCFFTLSSGLLTT